MVGEPPFDEPLRRLPWGVSAVDLGKPFVVRIDDPNGAGSQAGAGPAVRIGPGATTIELWSPQAGCGTLSLAAPTRRRRRQGRFG